MIEFTEEKQKMFKLVSLTNKVRVKGSASQKQIHYADVDLLTIDKLTSDEKILEHFQNVFKEINKMPNAIVTDFKCGHNGKGIALRWNYDDMMKGINNGVAFKEALGQTSTIKLDCVMLVDRFIEVTSMYDFGENYIEVSDKDFIDGLVEDYQKHVRDGNLFKALKRVFLILKITDKGNKHISILLNYFNGKFGLLYRLKADLETTLLILNETKFKMADIKNSLDDIKEKLSFYNLKNELIDIQKI